MPGEPGRPVALLFPGQGAQHPRMAAGLYGHYAAFTAVMDRAFGLLGDAGPELRADWLSDRPSARFDDATQAQPLLYAVNCALGQQVLSWGVEPAALLGHSVGEMTAATLAGVFGFTSGMTLMREGAAGRLQGLDARGFRSGGLHLRLRRTRRSHRARECLAGRIPGCRVHARPRDRDACL